MTKGKARWLRAVQQQAAREFAVQRRADARLRRLHRRWDRERRIVYTVVFALGAGGYLAGTLL